MPNESLDEIPRSKKAIRPLRRLILPTLLALVVLGLAVRFVWVVSQTEIGWQTVRQQWCDATIGWFTGDRVPIACRPPVEQAEYWLAETERILAEDPDNAELAAAAALLLDSPGSGFEYYFLLIPPDNCGFEGPPPEKLKYFPLLMDSDAVTIVVDDFEERCHRRCLEYAARATELQPDEPRWWRLRAWLLFRYHLHSYNRDPRDLRWLEVLAECKEHDSDNALYDYLAAWGLWREGVDTSSLDQKVIDEKKFQRGMECFLRGQEKEYLAVGGDEPALVIEFLRHSKLPYSEYEGVASNKSIILRLIHSLMGIWRINSTQIERLEQAGELPEALAVRRRNGHIYNQFYKANELISSDVLMQFIREADLNLLVEFLEKHPELVSEEEFQQIKTAAEEADTNAKLMQDAGNRLSYRQSPVSIPYVLVRGVLTGAAVQSIVFLLLFGVCICAASKLTGQRGRRISILGIFGIAFVWVCGYLVSFAVLGLAPAGIISVEIQKWVAPIGISMLIAAAVGWLFWKTVVKSNFHHTSRIILAIAIILSAGIGANVLWVLSDAQSGFGRALWNLYIPPRGWQDIAPDFVRQAIVIVCGRWNWALVQWMVYLGPLAAVGVSIASFLLCGKLSHRWSGVFAGAGRSAYGVAVLWLIVYLWLMPGLVWSGDQSYQARMVRLRDPQASYEILRKEAAEIRAEGVEKQE